MLNSKDIEQKAKEFLAERGITSFTKHDALTYTTTTDLLDYLEQFGAILTTACQQAKGDIWNNVDYGNPKAFPTVVGEYNVVIKSFYDKEAGFLDEHSNQVYATHWQPLPTAPAEKKRLLSEITDEDAIEYYDTIGVVRDTTISRSPNPIEIGNDMKAEIGRYMLTVDNLPYWRADYLRSKNYEI